MKMRQAEIDEILAVRARALARPPITPKGPGDYLEVVSFELAQEHYAIEALYVAEVVGLVGLTAIPGLPPFVLGIVNLRGKIFSVIDLKHFFDLPMQSFSKTSRLIVLQSVDMEFAILADTVIGAGCIGGDVIQPPLPTLSDIRAEYLKGVTAERLIVLDGWKLLTDSRLVI